MNWNAGVPPANEEVQYASIESTNRGWYSRGTLPHFDRGEIPQFVTIREADSLPSELLREWRETLNHKPKQKAELQSLIEGHLDKGAGHAWLKIPAIANVIEKALLHFDGQCYQLHSWVIMPNHIHFLITPTADNSLPNIIHSLKSFSAKEANSLLKREGKFWHNDYYDRYIRSEDHYDDTVEYIEKNPVGARLCDSAEKWPFSSANKHMIGGRDAHTPVQP